MATYGGGDQGNGNGNNFGDGQGNGQGKGNGNGNGQGDANGQGQDKGSHGKDIDGYLSGATVFQDINNNGKLDAGESSTVTDSQGNFFLPVGSGQLISIGGTDTLTGLNFTGVLSASAGSGVITPLTTLVNQVAQKNGGDVAAAQTAVENALGLSTSLNLDTLDPIAATEAGQAGAATALGASAELINTATLVSATGASSSLFAVLANKISQGTDPIDLTNAATVTALATGAGASPAAASAVGQIAAASNSVVAQAVQTQSADPASLVSAIAGASQTAQGTTASAVTAAGNDPTLLAQAVVGNTGSALASEIAQNGGGSSGVIVGPPSQSADDAQIVQDFLSGLFSSLGNLPVTYVSGSGSGVTNASLDTSIGVVTPGSNVNLHVTTDAALLVTGGSIVDLSGSPALNAAGRHLGVSVDLGDGSNTVTLNHGPSVAQSSIGNDTLISTGGHDTLSGGFGHDSMVGGGRSLLLGGQVGGDTLQGGAATTSHDTIEAGVGGDLIKTSAGQNLIYGNENDTIRAGLAQDTILSGVGAETIHGGLASTIYGDGMATMDRGNQNIYNATGADTIFGSNHHNMVNLQDGSNGVVVDGTTGTGSLNVHVNTSGHGNDTLFGGTHADGTGSNMTVHVTQAFTEASHLDKNGLNVVHLAGGQTLHVSNVTIDFNGTKTQI